MLIEGDADEIVPNAKLAADMHGFVIMVPPGEEGERLLDMLWRITMVYTCRPDWLRRRAKVSKMVEAVMSKESRKDKPARRLTRKSAKADRTQGDELALSSPITGPALSPNAKLRRAIASLPASRDGSKTRTRK